jgi:hypothetical protein
MPRGPHDDEIAEQDQETDHARKRLEEFRQYRMPASDQPEEPNEKNSNSVEHDQPEPQGQ